MTGEWYHTYQAPLPRSLSPMLKDIKILIAEDDMMMLKLLRDMLSAIGFSDITSVNNGQKALQHLRYSEVDILIADWAMHPMDGLTLTKRIREEVEGTNRYVPIVMLTGKGEKQDVMTARDAGVTEYIVKPFNANTLYKRIESVIENPRSFVLSKNFKGPDRRRRKDSPPDGHLKRRSDPV